VNVVLISTYELGHQPFGLASPKAWLVREGHSVRSVDLAVEPLPEADIRQAGLIAFYLSMHTATRLALPVIEHVRRLNPSARLAAYGLYAPLNAELLRGIGVEAIAGGEFEPALVKLARGETVGDISLDRLDFVTPDRRDLGTGYAQLHHGRQTKQVAYTEATRGCKHLCRHCPIVPVYHGQFRVVQRDVVLADIRQQLATGARHVTFGDPDFFNGPAHAAKIVESLHAEFPEITYDATIKIEHLLKHRDLLAVLRDTGCLFITSAVESVDDHVLAKLEKNHTRANFVEAVELTRRAGLILQPTFIAFTPWTTIEGYRELLAVIRDLDLVENVAPVQLALRLLVTTNSRLLELADVQASIGRFDLKSLVYPWKHSDPEVDVLAHRVFKLVHERRDRPRSEVFAQICSQVDLRLENFDLTPRATIPYLDEPWYC
jgi:radical SAM superfamily enzyme YgiQ (UPF0313 family)